MTIKNFIVPLAGLMILGCAGSDKSTFSNGNLAPCPDSPNCVSSLDDDAKHGMAPIAYTSTPEAALEKLIGIIQSMPRTEILKQEESYIHATFTSKVFRFTDDVEFLLDKEARKIHFRSASRVGYSDLGANRKRMDAIVEAFTE